jgi:hypothetical protein
VPFIVTAMETPKISHRIQDENLRKYEQMWRAESTKQVSVNKYKSMFLLNLLLF